MPDYRITVHFLTPRPGEMVLHKIQAESPVEAVIKGLQTWVAPKQFRDELFEVYVVPLDG